MIGRNLAESTASGFLSMKMVLASIKCFSSLSHQIIKLRTMTRKLMDSARGCLGVMLSGPGAIDKCSVADFISPGLIESQRPSSVGRLLHEGTDPVAGLVITLRQWDSILSLGVCGVSPIPSSIVSTRRPRSSPSPLYVRVFFFPDQPFYQRSCRWFSAA